MHTHQLSTAVALLALCAAAAHAAVLPRVSNSQYIHSNDTILLSLSSRTANALHGPVGSTHNLEFVLVNQGRAGHFSIM